MSCDDNEIPDSKALQQISGFLALLPTVGKTEPSGAVLRVLPRATGSRPVKSGFHSTVEFLSQMIHIYDKHGFSRLKNPSYAEKNLKYKRPGTFSLSSLAQ